MQYQCFTSDLKTYIHIHWIEKCKLKSFQLQFEKETENPNLSETETYYIINLLDNIRLIKKAEANKQGCNSTLSV